jgi:hypothetical protein
MFESAQRFKLMGAPTKDIAEGTLQGLGMIKHEKREGIREMVAVITAKGRKAVERGE